MKKTMLLTAAVLGLSAGAALAGSPPPYNVVGNPFPMRTTMSDVVAAPPGNDTGSQSYQSSAPRYAVAPVDGRLLPTNGSQGIVQTANSLPPGFAQGTPTYAQGQSTRRYLAEQAGTDQSADKPIVEGRVLPPDGAQGIVQTTNSLPPGFEQGTPDYAQGSSVRR
jgi:hypothetical protein